MKTAAAVVGIGQSTFTRRGASGSDAAKLAFAATLSAIEDAGIDRTDIDGFASFAGEAVDPARMAAALGCRELRFSALQWGGGGGGVCGALMLAAMAIATGQARNVVVYRSIVQPPAARYGASSPAQSVRGEHAFLAPYGVANPAQYFAPKIQRFLEINGLPRTILEAVALASYHHAQRNPAAVMYGRPLTPATYAASRWIAEPLKLYDCCQESDAAVSLVITSAERALDLRQKPAHILAACAGAGERAGASLLNAPQLDNANFREVGRRLFAQAGLRPADVDVLQSYENFTGGVVMSMIELGFCAIREAEDFFTFDNLVAPSGQLPINTSGGHLAEAYVHGMNLIAEAVRQLRGTSTNQVPGVQVAMASGGPLTAPVSACLLGSEPT